MINHVCLRFTGSLGLGTSALKLGKSRTTKMSCWPYLQGFAAIYLDGFCHVSWWPVACGLSNVKGNLWLCLMAKKRQLTLPWMVSIQILLTLTQSCLSSRSFQASPDLSQPTCPVWWSSNTRLIGRTVFCMNYFTFAIKHCWLWFPVERFYLLKDPWRQEVRALCLQQVKIMDSGLG